MVKDGFMNWVYIEMRIENVTKRERERGIFDGLV